MNFASMLSSTVTPLSDYVPKRPSRAKSAAKKHKSIRGKTHAEAREMFRSITLEPISTADIAEKLGRKIHSVLNQMYRYEDRGYVKRVGKVPRNGTNPTLLWQWVANT